VLRKSGYSGGPDSKELHQQLAGRYIVYRLIWEILQSDAGPELPADLTRELEESMFEAYAAEDG
jgi:hypothetical protein